MSDKKRKPGAGLSSIRDMYLDLLDEVLRLFEHRAKRNQNLMHMLESLKNSLIGKAHMPHAYLIENGVHAITFEAAWSSRAAIKDSTSHVVKVRNVIGLMERMVRAFDQLDEQLHAGFYFFILTSSLNFVSNGVFIYPVALVLASFGIPACIDLYQYFEEAANDDSASESEARKAQANQVGPELKFIGGLYSLCFMFISAPSLVVRFSPSSTISDLCETESGKRQAYADQFL